MIACCGRALTTQAPAGLDIFDSSEAVDRLSMALAPIRSFESVSAPQRCFGTFVKSVGRTKKPTKASCSTGSLLVRRQPQLAPSVSPSNSSASSSW